MTLAELLDSGLQLPGNVWTMLSLWCFTPVGGVTRSLWRDSGGLKYLFSTYGWIWALKQKVLTVGNSWQGRFPVVWIVMLRLLNLSNTAVEGLLLGMLRLVWPCWKSESTSWSDSLKDLSLPRRWLKISGMYIFQVLQLRAGLLILIWMACLASLAPCLLSQSIILKWEMSGWVLVGDYVLF